VGRAPANGDPWRLAVGLSPGGPEPGSWSYIGRWRQNAIAQLKQGGSDHDGVHDRHRDDREGSDVGRCRRPRDGGTCRGAAVDPSVSINMETGVVAATFQVQAKSIPEAADIGIALYGA
jgi:hypothetical protein